MVMVRGKRSTISNTELVLHTFEAFQDKKSLEDYRSSMVNLVGAGNYNETYLANPFLARFVVTKFFDNTILLEDVRMGKYAADIWKITLDKIAALLPTPLLKLIGVNLDKKDVEFSIGDALYFMQYGSGLGGYRVGSSIGHGLGLMGPFIYIVVIPLYITIFIALNSLTSFTRGMVSISPIILLQIMSIYSLACGDSLLVPIGMLLRTLPQNILLYWIIFHATRWLSGFNQRRIFFQYRRKKAILREHSILRPGQARTESIR
jgi:hypothetical protein